MGGTCGGRSLFGAGGTAHPIGRSTTPPGEAMRDNAINVARSVAVWPARSPGSATFSPHGRSSPATRGTPTDEVRAGIVDNVMVENLAASIRRCTSPTDQQQTGHTGTSTTASTCSARRPSMISGTLSSRSRRGRSV